MLKGLTIQWIATSYVAVISACLSFFLARTLGPNEFGIYNFYLALGMLIASAQDGGFHALLIREKTTVSKSLKFISLYLPHYALVNNLLVTTFAILIIVLIPIHNKLLIVAAVICLSLNVLCQTISAIFKGDGKFGKDALWQISFRSITALVIVLAATFSSLSPLSIFIYWTVGSFLAFAVGAINQLNNIPAKYNYYLVYREAFPLAVVSLTTTIYFKIDIVMLGYLLNDNNQVGYYSAAHKFIEGIILFFTPISFICFQNLRRNWLDKIRFESLLIKMIGFMLAASLITILLLNWLGPWLVKLAYGEEFWYSSKLLIWLSFALLFIIPNMILTQAVIANNKSITYALITIITSFSCVVMNYYFIPRFGSLGAALVTIISEALMCGLLLVSLKSTKHMT